MRRRERHAQVHVGSAVAEWRVQELQTKRLTRRDTIDTITRRAVGVVSVVVVKHVVLVVAPEPLGDVSRRRGPAQRGERRVRGGGAVRVLARDAYHLGATHVHVHGIHRGAVVRARAAERARPGDEAHQAGAEHLDVFRSGAERLRRVVRDDLVIHERHGRGAHRDGKLRGHAVVHRRGGRRDRDFRVALDVEHALKVRPVLFGHFRLDVSRLAGFGGSGSGAARADAGADAVFRAEPARHPPPPGGLGGALFLPAGRHVRVPELAAYLRVRERAEQHAHVGG